MNEFLGMIRSFGVARLAAIIGVTAGVAIALALIVARIGEPPLGILYANLDLANAESVVERLDQDGVKHKMREAGGRVSILVPSADIPRLKVRLAADGVVRENGVGYEIFDKEDAFGATTFQQNINRLRALEGELARTIASIDGVRSARVHLVLPERELFARDKQPATASIVVDAPRGLDQRSVRAIANLAASAVPELSPSRVTVLDAAGELLASGQAEDPTSGGVDERTAATEARLRRTVEDIVGRIVGAENLRVQVAAELDFSRVTENAEIIDPDSQTVLSSTTVEESEDSNEPSIGRGVTVANALPGAQQTTDTTAAATTNNRRTEETTNYEISRTVRSEVKEQGAIKRVSVAVALNAIANAPRSPEDLARINALVKSAIGFSETRGDKVDVVEIGFTPIADTVAGSPPAAAPAFSREQAMRLAEVGALALIALALVVFVLRPMLAPAKAGVEAIAVKTSAPAAVASAAAAQTSLPPPNSAFEQKIDLARVEGQVKASSLNKVSEVVRGHTDESIGILKGWIRQAS